MKTETSIFSKDYTSLTAEEKAEHLELFQDEETFNQLKNTILHIENTMKEDIITPQEATKSSLMEQFEEKWSKKGMSWYEQIGIFLFQPNKPLFYKPVFQMACLAILIVGIFQWNPMQQNTSVVASSQMAQSEKIEAAKATPPPAPPSTPANEPNQPLMDEINAPHKEARDASVQSMSTNQVDADVLEQNVDKKITTILENKNAEMYAGAPLTTISESVADGEMVSDEFSHSDWLKTSDKKEKSASKNLVFTTQEKSLLDLLETAY